MATTPVFIIRDSFSVGRILKGVAELIIKGLGAGPVVLKLERETRTNEQNAKQWPMLQDICRTKPMWPKPDGSMCKMTPTKYKDMLTASLYGTEFCLNADQSGVVCFGLRTSQMNKKTFSELIEFYYSFGAQIGVEWSEPSLKVYEEYKELNAEEEAA